MTEDNALPFAGYWTGTGAINGAGDPETLCLDAGEYMESDLINTGAGMMELLQNTYDGTGDDVLLRYRTGANPADCLAAAWADYVAPFMSLGIVQVRLEYA